MSRDESRTGRAYQKLKILTSKNPRTVSSGGNQRPQEPSSGAKEGVKGAFTVRRESEGGW